MDQHDNTESGRRSNVTCIGSGFDRGWEQFSVPWLSHEDIRPEAASSIPTSNAAPLDHIHSSPNSPYSSYFNVNSFENLSTPSYNIRNTLASTVHPPIRRFASPSPFAVLDTEDTYRQSSTDRHRETSSDDSLFRSSLDSHRSNPDSSYVDLTEDTPVMPTARKHAKPHVKSSLEPSEPDLPLSKRRKTESTTQSIEEVDLRDVDSDSDLARVLERQRAATVREQQEHAEKSTKLAKV